LERRAWSLGQGAWGKQVKRKEKKEIRKGNKGNKKQICPLPLAQHTPCSLPHAPCALLFTLAPRKKNRCIIKPKKNNSEETPNFKH